MNAGTRLLVGALVRLVLLGYAVWFAIREDALGAGVPMVSRIGIVILFVILSVLVGEISQMRMHLSLLARGALAAARSGGGLADSVSRTAPADPRQPIEILLQALRTTEGETQAKAHAHLQRLTGQDLPLDPVVWDSWWQNNRDTFQAP